MPVPVIAVGECRAKDARTPAQGSKRSRDSVAKMTGGQAEMGEDLGDHGGIFDACPEPVEGATMIVKVPPHCGHLRDVDSEHPFEQPGPAHGGWRQVMGCVTVVSGV